MALAQTTYYSIMESPSGHRMIQQVGRAGFVAKGKKKTLTIGFRRLVHGMVQPGQGPPSAGGYSLRLKAYIPYISATQYTQAGLASRGLIVSRQTGVVSALVFSYSLVGY